MRIFATFRGAAYLSKGDKSKTKWSNLSDECGADIEGDFLTQRTAFLDSLKLKVGNRYMLECHSAESNKITTIIAAKNVFKNKRCDVMRKALGTFHFIKGKYKQTKFEEIDSVELTTYMIWLARNSKNEATIKNSLEVLALLNKNS